MLEDLISGQKGKCKLCGKEGREISRTLSLCLSCIRQKPAQAIKIGMKAQARARKEVSFPPKIPKASQGVECTYCANHCRISEGEEGYCGLSRNEQGRLVRDYGTPEKAIGSWYKDPHPTNCVAVWHCAGGTGAGYPKYAKWPHGDRGYNSAAIFLGTCCYHCLYCQNTSWPEMAAKKGPILKSDKLVEQLLSDPSLTCACWFGGTPEPQMPFVLEVSERIVEKTREQGRIFRICLESNGNFSWPWLKKIAELSLESGGGIKFDLKTWDENLNQVLSGASNKATYENFKKLGRLHLRRKDPPFLRASTLLVPGYIDLEEIRKIARFIATVNPSIPYSLLAFGPAYHFVDQPLIKKDFAFKAKAIAEEEGLERVRVGNKQLLM